MKMKYSSRIIKISKRAVTALLLLALCSTQVLTLYAEDTADTESAAELSGTSDSSGIFRMLDEPVAVQTYIEGDSTVTVYGDFTVVEEDSDETADFTTMLEDSRLILKRGSLISVSSKLEFLGGRIDQIVVDSITSDDSEIQYLSILGTDHTVQDYYTGLVWPDELSNAGIAEISNTLETSNTILVVRYTDNTVAAFNYLTGTLVFYDDTEKTEVSFLEFASTWLTNLRSTFFAGYGDGYSEILLLEEELTENPIDGEIILGILSGSSDGYTGDGTGTADGTAGEEGSGTGSETGETTGGTGASSDETGTAADETAGTYGDEASTEGDETAAAGEAVMAEDDYVDDSDTEGTDETALADETNTDAASSSETVEDEGESEEDEDESEIGDDESADADGKSGGGAVTAGTDSTDEADTASEAATSADVSGAETGTSSAETDIASAGITEGPSDGSTDDGADGSSDADAEESDEAGVTGDDGADTEEEGTGTKEDEETDTVSAAVITASAGQYLTYYDPETGTYLLYDTDEYLSGSSSGGTLLSENEKIELLEANGYSVGAASSIIQKLAVNSGFRYLYILFAAILVLLFILLMVRGRMNRAGRREE